MNEDIQTLIALFQSGRLDEAETLARRLTQCQPREAFGWKALGTILGQAGRHAEARPALERALELRPKDAELLNALCIVLRALDQPKEALRHGDRALRLRPDYAEAHSNRGNALSALQRFPEALDAYRQALALRPNYADAYVNLASALRELGRLDQALDACDRALGLQPGQVHAHRLRGTLLRDLSRPEEALLSYRRALELAPDAAEDHNNLGAILVDLDRLDEARQHCEQALRLQPDFIPAHVNLGSILKHLGQTEAVLAQYAQAARAHPQDFTLAVLSRLALPAIPESVANIECWRGRYRQGIAELMDWPGTAPSPGGRLNTESFYLAYHDRDDRPLMEALCRLFRAKTPEVNFVAPHLDRWRPGARAGGRIRLGLLSQFLSGHTIGRLNAGLIEHLDRRRFEVVLLHAPGARQDDFSRAMDQAADQVIRLPPALPEQQRAVAAAGLDVLFYPDIGMSPATYMLAHARLAPVQIVTWGHPDTTGLDSIDYFLSSTGMEPENSANHYTERLIKLNRMPCYYPRPVLRDGLPGRAALGLPEQGTLYGCPQSLFKFHPEFDPILAAIVEGDPRGHLILLEGHHAAWTARLRARWARTHPVLLERVRFVPRRTQYDFIALQANLDVLLDPPHFGGGNTMFEALSYGTPAVTWPGRFMRGRILYCAYRQMDVPDAPIAARLDDYAPLALALGRDAGRRHALRRTLAEAAADALFNDRRMLREFERFLEAAVEAARTGERLPTNWAPSPE